MGKPGGSYVPSSMNESIVHEKGTRGTETSKYPEEEKETSISLVAASERERGQTGYSNITGVADCIIDSDSLVEMHGKAYHRR